MEHELINIRLGDDRYEELLGQIRGDEQLLARMWTDAEHRLNEVPGKTWTVAAVRTPAGWVTAAWAASLIEDGDGEQVLRCCDNYEHPSWRGRGLYEAAYRHRHRTIVQPGGLPGVTYLFSGPIGLHEADGWHRTGVQGVSTAAGVAHEWWQLCRPSRPGHPEG